MSGGRGPTILISAGEASGDVHAARVVREVRELYPGAHFLGVGGPRCAEEGVELLATVDRLAILGLTEVVAHLPYLRALLGRMRRIFDQDRPALVLPVDYPGFNLRLAGMARRAGIPVLYYIAPQVWAWGRGRAHRIARDVDRLAVILPFEEAIFRSAGAEARFVGHPLLEELEVPTSRAAFRAEHGIDPQRPLLALHPGSRVQEVRHLLPLFLRVGRRLAADVAGLQMAIGAPSIPPVVESCRRIAGRTGVGVVVGRSAELISHSDLLLTKSGSSTLEAALLGTPMVIAYRLHPLTYWIARGLVSVPRIGLVNIVAGRPLVPEFLQGAAREGAIAGAARALLQGSDGARAQREGFREVRAVLGGPGAARRVALLARELIG